MWPARPAACDLLSFTLVLCHALPLSFSLSLSLSLSLSRSHALSLSLVHPTVPPSVRMSIRRVLVARLVLDPCALVTAGRFIRDPPHAYIHTYIDTGARARAQDYGNACGVAMLNAAVPHMSWTAALRVKFNPR